MGRPRRGRGARSTSRRPRSSSTPRADRSGQTRDARGWRSSGPTDEAHRPPGRRRRTRPRARDASTSRRDARHPRTRRPRRPTRRHAAGRGALSSRGRSDERLCAMPRREGEFAMNARVDRTVPKNDRGTRERVDQIDRHIGRAELVFVRVRNCARARLAALHPRKSGARRTTTRAPTPVGRVGTPREDGASRVRASRPIPPRSPRPRLAAPLFPPRSRLSAPISPSLLPSAGCTTARRSRG